MNSVEDVVGLTSQTFQHFYLAEPLANETFAAIGWGLNVSDSVVGLAQTVAKVSESVPGTAIKVFGVVPPVISGSKAIAKAGTNLSGLRAVVLACAGQNCFSLSWCFCPLCRYAWAGGRAAFHSRCL